MSYTSPLAIPNGRRKSTSSKNRSGQSSETTGMDGRSSAGLLEESCLESSRSITPSGFRAEQRDVSLETQHGRRSSDEKLRCERRQSFSGVSSSSSTMLDKGDTKKRRYSLNLMKQNRAKDKTFAFGVTPLGRREPWKKALNSSSGSNLPDTKDAPKLTVDVKLRKEEPSIFQMLRIGHGGKSPRTPKEDRSEKRRALNQSMGWYEYMSRWARVNITSKAWFDNVILILILFNCVLLAFSNPLNPETHWEVKVSRILDPIFLSIFIIEMFLKILALGLWRETKSEEELPGMPEEYYASSPGYFRDGWNYIDFVVVVFGCLGAIPSVPNVSAIRVVRVLRPLRAVKRVPQLRALVTVLLYSVAAIGRVSLVLSLLLFFFGITGVTLFKGILRQRCFDDASGETLPLDRICSLTSAGLFQCPHGSTCKPEAGNPFYGVVSFDDFPSALLQIFQTITMSGWGSILHTVMDGVSPFVWFYFFFLILLVSFFALNLMLAAIKDAFRQLHTGAENEKAKMQHQEMQEKKKLKEEKCGVNGGEEDDDNASGDGVPTTSPRSAPTESCGKVLDADDEKDTFEDAPSTDDSKDPEETFKIQVLAAVSEDITLWIIEQKRQIELKYRLWLRSEGCPVMPAGFRLRSHSRQGSSRGEQKIATSGGPLQQLLLEHRGFWPVNDHIIGEFLDEFELKFFQVPAFSALEASEGGGKWFSQKYAKEVAGRRMDSSKNAITASRSDRDLDNSGLVARKGGSKSTFFARENKYSNREALQLKNNINMVVSEHIGYNEMLLLHNRVIVDKIQGRLKNIRLEFLKNWLEKTTETERNALSMIHSFWSVRYPTLWLQNKPAVFRSIFVVVTSSMWMKIFVNLVILLNTAALSYNYYGISTAEEKFIEEINFACALVFLVEMLLKLAGLGLRGYLCDPWNRFDAFIVLISFIPNANQVSGLRTLRLLRIFKLFNNVRDLRKLFVVIINCLVQVMYLILLVMVFLFMFAVLGVQLFAGKLTESTSRWSFDDLWASFLLVFQCVSGDSWPDVMWEITAKTSRITPLYFVSLIVLGDFMIVNLFIAMLLIQFQDDEQLQVSIARDIAMREMLKDTDPKEIIKIQVVEGKRQTQIEDRQKEIKRMQYEYYLGEKDRKELEKAEKKRHSVLSKINIFRRKSLSPGHSSPSISAAKPFSGMSSPRSPKQAESLNLLQTNIPEMILKGGGVRKPISEGGTSGLSSAASLFPETKTPERSNNDHKDGYRRNTPKNKKNTTRAIELMPLRTSAKATTEAGTASRLAGGETKHQGEVAGIIGTPSPTAHLQSIRRSRSMDSPSSHRMRRRQSSVLSNIEVQQIREKAMITSFGMRPDHPLRKRLIAIVEKRWFKNGVSMLVAINCIILAIDDPHSNEPNPAFFGADIAFTIVFALEMLIKIVAMGPGPRTMPWAPLPPLNARKEVIEAYAIDGTYFGDAFNRIDGLIVILSVLSFLPGAEFLRISRAFRPLRILVRMRNTRVVLLSTAEAMPSVANIALFLVVLFVVFAILCVDEFKGKFFSCTIPDVRDKAECLSRGGQWKNADFNFDNMYEAFLTLFRVATTSNWNVIMYASIDAVGVEMQPSRNHAPAWGLFYIIFIFLSSMFAMNLFVAVLIDKFNKLHQQFNGSAFLTEEQRRMKRDSKLASRTRLPKNTSPLNHGYLCKYFYRLVGQPNNPEFMFESFILTCIGLNALITASQHYQEPQEWVIFSKKCLFECFSLVVAVAMLRLSVFVFMSNIFFNVIFSLEVVIKLSAWGCRMYFSSGWNIFDFVVVLISLGSYGLADGGGLSALRLFRLARLFRVVARVKALRSLFDTLLQSSSSLINVGSLIFIIFYIYAILGVNLFGKIAWADPGLSQYENFSSFPSSILTLWRLATGDSWEEIQTGLSLDESSGQCSDSEGNCGYPWSPVYTISFMIFVALVMVNLFIAVILESFSTATQDSESSLESLHEWRDIWSAFDPQGTGFLPATDVIHLLSSVGQPIGVSTDALRNKGGGDGKNDNVFKALIVMAHLKSNLPLCVFQVRAREYKEYKAASSKKNSRIISPLEVTLDEKDDLVWVCHYEATLRIISKSVLANFSEEEARLLEQEFGSDAKAKSKNLAKAPKLKLWVWMACKQIGAQWLARARKAIRKRNNEGNDRKIDKIKE
eukprot:jgi/Bigna1/69667/fgenesh1_pg.9_\